MNDPEQHYFSLYFWVQFSQVPININWNMVACFRPWNPSLHSADLLQLACNSDLLAALGLTIILLIWYYYKIWYDEDIINFIFYLI